MNAFFYHKKKFDLAWMKTDLHNHILPGIDDGCSTIEQSLDCIQGLAELGIQNLMSTPHIFNAIYPNNAQTINNALLQTVNALRTSTLHSSLTLGAAAEYMVDDYFMQLLKDGASLLTLPGNLLLIEMSYLHESPHIEQSIFELRIQGYTPILAHPERYVFYHQKPAKIQRLQDMGCLLQLNLLSLTGYYGPAVKKCAEYLVKNRMINFIATDLHHQAHLKAITKFAINHDIQRMLAHCPIDNHSLTV